MALEVDEIKVPTDDPLHPAGHHTILEWGLARILSFPPLLQAFEGFCLKALCIEVRPSCLARFGFCFATSRF